MKMFLLAIFCFAACTACAQQYMYVNTDNLIMRSRPGREYDVLAVLHAGYVVEITPYQYGETKAEMEKFYFVTCLFGNNSAMGEHVGYIEKQYLVSSPRLITVPVTHHNSDTGISAYSTLVPPPDYNDLTVQYPTNNRTLFPYPKYKGGEHSFPVPKKREYHRGPHGGCYYLDVKGHKKYVDRKYCK